MKQAVTFKGHRGRVEHAPSYSRSTCYLGRIWPLSVVMGIENCRPHLAAIGCRGSIISMIFLTSVFALLEASPTCVVNTQGTNCDDARHR